MKFVGVSGCHHNVNNYLKILILVRRIIQEILNGDLGPLISEIIEGNNTFAIEDENDVHLISTLEAIT